MENNVPHRLPSRRKHSGNSLQEEDSRDRCQQLDQAKEDAERRGMLEILADELFKLSHFLTNTKEVMQE